MRFASISNEVKVSQWSDGEEIYVYKPQSIENLPINSVSWGKNGTWLMLAKNFGSAEIISLKEETAKLLHSIHNVKNSTCAVFHNLSTRNVALGTSSGQIVIYDIKNKSIKKQFPTQPLPIFKVQCTLKDSHIIGASKDGKLFVYKTSSGMQTNVLTVPRSRTITNFRCHPAKTNILGVCSEEGIVAVLDYNVDKPVACYTAHKALVSDLLFKQDNLISIGVDRRLCLMDYRSNKLTSEAYLHVTPSAIDLSNDGYSLAIGFIDGNVLGFDLRSMKENMGVLAKHAHKINQIAFDNSTNGNTDSISEQVITDNASNKSESSQQTESFSQIYCDALPVNSDAGKENADIIDSFMNALLLDADSVTSMNSVACSITDGVKRLMDSRPNLLSPKPEDNARLNNTRRSLEVGNKAHSTPVHLNELVHSPIYPINTNKPATPITETDIRRIVKETIREEMDDLKDQMKYYIYEVLNSIKQNSLGMQWSISKLSVQVDENFDHLRNDMFQSDEPF